MLENILHNFFLLFLNFLKINKADCVFFTDLRCVCNTLVTHTLKTTLIRRKKCVLHEFGRNSLCHLSWSEQSVLLAQQPVILILSTVVTVYLMDKEAIRK